MGADVKIEDSNKIDNLSKKRIPGDRLRDPFLRFGSFSSG